MNKADPERTLPSELMVHFQSGAWFDLSLEIGPSGVGAPASTVLAGLWTFEGVDGPWAAPTGEKGPKGPFGILKAADAAPPLPFAACWVCEQEGSDWLTLGIPVRALQSYWTLDGSWSASTQPWLMALCSALSRVADHLYAQIPFANGVMGEEVSGCWRRPTLARAKKADQGYPPLALLTAEIIDCRGAFVVAPDLWTELGVNSTPVALPSGLLYSPPKTNANLTGA